MYELTSLDNDLRILTVTLPHVQSVSLGFFVAVGSRYESEAMAGASHFVEHMLFKGTDRRPTALAIAEAIEGKGGMFNASTGLEATLYWAKVAAAHLPEALDVLSDMLLRANFDPREIEKERAVISEEINYAFDAPDSLAQILVNRMQWPNHPLGREIAGSRQSVAALCREDLIAYLADHYQPSQTVLGVAGQVGHGDVAGWAEANLIDWVPGAPMAFEPAPDNHDGPNLYIQPRDTEQSHLCFSFGSLSRSDPDRFALRLLNMILGEGMRSRLFQQVREQLGLAYSVDSYVSTLQDTGSVGIYAGVAAGRAAEAIEAILSELDRTRQELVTEEELRKAKDFLRGRLTLSMEDSFTVAAWYARQELLGSEILSPEDVLAHYDALQADDLQRMARTVFVPQRLNLAVVGPHSEQDEQLCQAVSF